MSVQGLSNDQKAPSFKRRLAAGASRAITYLQSGWRGKAITLVFLSLTVVAIVSIILANQAAFNSYRWQLRPVWLAYAAGFVMADLFLGAFAWHLLVARLACYSDPRYNLKYWGYANLAKRLPGPVWYIASRAALYEQQGVSKMTTSLLSGLELVLVLVSGIVTFLLSLPFWALPAELAGRLYHSWFLILLFPLCLLLVHPRVLNRLWQKLSRQTPVEGLRWQDTALWLLFYVFIWLVGALSLFSAINLFYPLSMSHFIPVAGMWAVANVISMAGTLTLSGIGLRELSLALLLTQVAPTPAALLIVVVIRIIWLVGEFLGALLSLTL
ncbi:MAG: hypothetical protein L0332_04370 [Chloroflexi bacterium]|nr:hypothetical protein [Chloroflexota bacterium]MCI0580102.1 hypothetical protein [Chloroflexota bacterium]MCI0649322.1 hypothetical protein [Chloroflexota bacterium]MCI0725945.1 hypothetical protein [Chloroflexota bacterium]